MNVVSGILNNNMPVVLVYAWCNHDVKLLTNANGDVTMRVAWYITKYAMKCQQKASNLSALLAEGLAYHFSEGSKTEDILKHNQLLLFHSYHSINHHSKQSAPQVMSYLMGWGDRVFSHQYVPLYWTSVIGYLIQIFPELGKGKKLVTSIIQACSKCIMT